MTLQKQATNVNFGQGLSTKDDPWQVPVGQMLQLVNSVFNKGGMLSKRNGYLQLPDLPLSSHGLTTFRGNALAIGDEIQMLSTASDTWVNKGPFTSISLSTITAARSATSQLTVDSAVSNDLACVAWQDSDTKSYYQVVGATTGQVVTAKTQLPTGAALPRVFVLGQYFVVTYLLNVPGVNLYFIAIPTHNPSSPTAPASLSSQVDNISAAYDGVVANDTLYLAFNGSDLGGAIRLTALNSHLQQLATVILPGVEADLLTLAADTTGSTAVIYLTSWDTTSNDGYVTVFNQNLVLTQAATQIINNEELITLTATAANGSTTVYYEVYTIYSYSSARTDILRTVSCTAVGVPSANTTILRSVGLASKAFVANDVTYMLVAYGSSFQPSYFLINSTGAIVARLAYSNGGGYMTTQILPSVTVIDNVASIGYLFKDLIAPVNKSQGAAAVSGVYAQLGINIANITIGGVAVTDAEIGGALHLTGGMLWMYDGTRPVEHNFQVWPDDITVTTSTTGGLITAQTYFYQVTYEWTDAAGNIHRSSPSIPYTITTTGSTSSNTLNIPYLRLTYKVAPNPVRIVIYRWSTAQQSYYQVTSVLQPQLNVTTSDSLAYVDTLADSAIIGNSLIYTTGGVLENIAAPAAKALTIFKSRLFLIDGENQNRLWYSKTVVENTPVEMSDLQTIYVAPTISSQGSTGVNQCLFPMDDKLILFKSDAAYYLTGDGPDITGANNDYRDPVFITATVGCANPNSIVFTPNGLMFQSDKGIWLLGRDLSTNYIGAPVEAYNANTVLSAFSVPGQNQVRFTLDNGITLMYDYYYNQWGTFSGIPAISSTIYQSLHTYIDQYNRTFQENPGSYLDGSRPVLMSFTTAWIKLAGLQGFQRAYYFYILGKYYSPHKLSISIGYDYVADPVQNTLITPVNFNGVYGSDPLYGNGSPYGGESAVEQWRVFLDRQKCQSFQITISELYDNTLDQDPGYGLTLSGLNLIVGVKKGYNTLAPRLSKG